MNKKYRTLFSNAGVFAISNVISKLILSLLLPLYSRRLTTGEYGTVELITTLSQLIYPAISLSIQDAVFRFAMDKEKKAVQVLKNGLVVCVGACAILFPVSMGINYYNGIEGYWIYFYAFSSLSMMRSMLSLYMKGIKKTGIFAVDVVLYNASLAIANIILLVGFNKGIDGYFIATVIASLISILFLLWNCNIKVAIRETVSKILLKEMILFSAPLILNSISWGLTHVVDRVMLTDMLGSGANGIYSAASKIPSLLSVITTVFTQAWTISLIADFETEKDRNFYSAVFNLTHVGCLICGLGILLFNNNLFVLILGKSFAEACKYVPVLLIGTLFLTYSNFFGSVFSATKKTTLNMYTSIAGCIFNVVFNFLLIPRIGIMGACIATAGSYVVISILRVYFSQRIFPISIEPIKYTISVLVIFICAIFVTKDYWAVPISVVSLLIEILLYYRYISSVLWKVKSKLKKKKKLESDTMSSEIK